MGNEIAKSLAQRAKELLQTDDEHNLFELAELLRQYRNETHPDKFQGQELKAKAEARFKDAQSLLDELEKQLEVDRFNRKPSELAVYKPRYDMAQLQSELDKAKQELGSTRDELKRERENGEDLRKQLQTKQDDSLRTEIEHLQSIYRPSTRNYASLGLAIFLSGALGVMSQMEKVSGILEKYSPFEKRYISTGLFVCLLLLLAGMLRKLWQSEYIKRKAEEACSPKCAHDFMEYLQHTKSSDSPVLEFSEVEVFDFLSGGRQRPRSIAVLFLGFQTFQRTTVNRIKDIFIHNLLNKKLVDFSRAEQMQRYFTVCSNRSAFEVYREYFTKKSTTQE